MRPYLIIATWVAFCVFWMSNVWSVKATVERQSLAAMLPSRLLTLAGGVLLFWYAPPHPLEIRIVSHTLASGCIGLLLCILGLGLAIWSRRTLGGNWSSLVALKQGHELVERGPYGLVRHPIYSAVLLMGLGTAVSFGRVGCWIGLLLLSWGFWLKLRQEERLLSRHFPGAYPAYMRRVKALVPWVFASAFCLLALASAAPT